jgi:hypothetical protein
MYRLIKKILNRTSKSIRPDARDNYLERIELSYLYSILNLFREVEKCPGHIVELGVGAGRNAIIFGNLLKSTGQDGSARYFGFDTFGSYTERDLSLESNLNRKKWENNSFKFVEERLIRHDLSDVSKLIEGDIRTTLPDFISMKADKKSAGHLYCRLVYVDCSAYEPAKVALDLLWDTMVPGGIMAIDQRTQGGEWKAAIDFCEEKGLLVSSQENTHFNSSPLIIRKK